MGFTKPMTCGLCWVSWEVEQSSGPSGQLIQGIILHFDDQVHSCTEEGISVSMEPDQNIKVPSLAAAKIWVESRVTWHCSPDPFLLLDP